MAVDDDLPRRLPMHEIGQDLSALSIEELRERVALLQREIDRLQAAAAAKEAGRSAAAGIFRS